jgi:hypothetical protein
MPVLLNDAGVETGVEATAARRQDRAPHGQGSGAEGGFSGCGREKVVSQPRAAEASAISWVKDGPKLRSRRARSGMKQSPLETCAVARRWAGQPGSLSAGPFRRDAQPERSSAATTNCLGPHDPGRHGSCRPKDGSRPDGICRVRAGTALGSTRIMISSLSTWWRYDFRRWLPSNHGSSRQPPWATATAVKRNWRRTLPR